MKTSTDENIKSVKEPLRITDQRYSKDGKVALYVVMIAYHDGGSDYHSLLWCYFENGKPVAREILPRADLKAGPRPMIISGLRSSVREGRKCKIEVGVQSAVDPPFSVEYAEVDVDLAEGAAAFQKRALERLEE